MKTPLLILALSAVSVSGFALERLNYDVRFGFLKAGEAEITYESHDNGYKISALAWTTTPLFNLKERIKIAGSDMFQPETFTMQQIENEYQATKSLQLKEDEAIYQKKGERAETFPTHGAVRDYMSQLFKLRFDDKELKKGQIITENVVGLSGAYRMELKVLGQKEIYTPATKWIKAFEVQPVLVRLAPKEGVNKDWRIYITADQERRPIKIEAKLKFGSFKALLTQVSDENSVSLAPEGLQTGKIFPK